MTKEPQTTYSAITRGDFIAAAPAASLQSAPFTFFDSTPAFQNTRLLRVTDSVTFPSVPNRTFWSPDGNANIFNCDSTRFLCHVSGGQWISFILDKDAFHARPLLSGTDPLVIPLQVPCFSYIDKDTLYGASWSGLKLSSYNLASGAGMDIVDLTQIQKGATGYAGLVSVSRTGKIATTFNGPSQDNLTCAVVYDLVKNTYKLLDLRAGTVFDSATNTTIQAIVNIGNNQTAKFTDYPTCGAHSSGLDGLGRFLILNLHNFTGGQCTVWDLENNNFTVMAVDAAGHYDLGSGFWCGSDGNYSNGWTLFNLSYPNESIKLNSQAGGWDYRLHTSWNNSSPFTPLTPCFFSNGPVTNNLVAWRDEIIAVTTSECDGPVYRFCKNHMVYDPNNWYTEVRSNVSQDGCYFLFDSNWDNTLGIDPNNSNFPRHDIFLVDLESAH